ncbi:hypothetical protein DAMA08_044650 [Martiniozyma asiatica (nom. inval.)]|nr:hypothetical protein DAMA08_044650 [Martiniozyma asiatica]
MFSITRAIPGLLGKRFASTFTPSTKMSAFSPLSMGTLFRSPIKLAIEPVEIMEPPVETISMEMTSVLRKRRLKMKKHKLRKRRKAQRALRIKQKK